MAPKYEAKAKERIRKGLLKYGEVLRLAAQRGIGEADTSTIVRDMLVNLLGYGEFGEVTGEYEVRGRWADWAVRINEALAFFVEVKPLGAKLRERDLFQVISYSRQHNLEWAVLTTGEVWQCHRVVSGQEPEEFFEIVVSDSTQAIDEKVDRLYLLAKEGFSRGALQERWSQAECLRPDRLAQLLLSEEVLAAVRRAVHRDGAGRRIEVSELREAVARGVIRGDLYDALSKPTAAKAVRRQRKRTDKGLMDPPPTAGADRSDMQGERTASEIVD